MDKINSTKTVLLLLSVFVLSVSLTGCANSKTAPAAQSQIQSQIQTSTPSGSLASESAPSPTTAAEQAPSLTPGQEPNPIPGLLTDSVSTDPQSLSKYESV